MIYRLTRALIMSLVLLSTSKSASANIPVDSDGVALTSCKIYAYYADKRPYESPKSDPFYAAEFAMLKPYDRRLRAAHLIVRTQNGLFEKDSTRAAFEFTLPTHEAVVSAWVDRTRDGDGNETVCDPSGAFFVDGLHDVAFTKQFLKHEKYGRVDIEALTQTSLAFGLIKFRDPGRRPAGNSMSLPSPCNLPDRNAVVIESVTISGTQQPGLAPSPSVLVDISPYGTVMNVDVKQTAGTRALDDAMIAATKDAFFTPARWKCVAVPDRTIVPVRILDKPADER